MMRISKVVLIVSVLAASPVSISQPIELDDRQMDRVTAGWFDMQSLLGLFARARAFATCSPAPCIATTTTVENIYPGVGASAFSSSTSSFTP